MTYVAGAMARIILMPRSAVSSPPSLMLQSTLHAIRFKHILHFGERQPSPSARDVTEPQDLQQTIQLIQKVVSDHFYLRELRDPDLKVRSHRQVFAFPRQLAMYIARQTTGASLQEIGREFGGRHHTTVLHAIKKIEARRRSDDAANHTVTQLVDAVLLHFGVSDPSSRLCNRSSDRSRLV